MDAQVRQINGTWESMRIGLIDVDGHAKVKKWGATVFPKLNAKSAHIIRHKEI